MNKEEKIDKRLLDDLKNLPRVDAPKNFETELLRKLHSTEEIKKESFWSKLLSPSRLAPAVVAIGTAIIIFFVVDINSEKIEDPLNIAPRLREDLVVVETIKEIPIETQKKSSKPKEKSGRISDSKGSSEKKDNAPVLQRADNDGFLDDQKLKTNEELVVDELESEANLSDSFRSKVKQELGGTAAPSSVNTISSEISRDKLNFMQRNLSTEDKMEVRQLKMKIQSEKSAKTQEKPTKAP
jgi:hypothetical protein